MLSLFSSSSHASQRSGRGCAQAGAPKRNRSRAHSVAHTRCRRQGGSQCVIYGHDDHANAVCGAVLREKWPLAFPTKHKDVRPLAIGAAHEIAAAWAGPFRTRSACLPAGRWPAIDPRRLSKSRCSIGSTITALRFGSRPGSSPSSPRIASFVDRHRAGGSGGRRPVFLTGVANVVTRPDLADRLVVVQLSPIMPAQRDGARGLRPPPA